MAGVGGALQRAGGRGHAPSRAYPTGHGHTGESVDARRSVARLSASWASVLDVCPRGYSCPSAFACVFAFACLDVCALMWVSRVSLKCVFPRVSGLMCVTVCIRVHVSVTSVYVSVYMCIYVPVSL